MLKHLKRIKRGAAILLSFMVVVGAALSILFGLFFIILEVNPVMGWILFILALFLCAMYFFGYCDENWEDND